VTSYNLGLRAVDHLSDIGALGTGIAVLHHRVPASTSRRSSAFSATISA